MKVYLAGPMSGKPAFNIPAFKAATKRLRDLNITVISPVELDGEEDEAILIKSETGDHADLPRSYDEYLATDLEIIRHEPDLDAIVTLDGWALSHGATREVATAMERGLPRYDYDPVFGMIMSADEEERAQMALYGKDGKWIKHEDNPLRQRTITGGVKDNKGKSRVDLIPFNVLIRVGRVLGFGATKYKPHNWRLGLGWSDTIGSSLRHIFAFAEGEDIDEESGECHIDNAIAQLMFLSEYYHTQTGTDDRWVSADREEAKA